MMVIEKNMKKLENDSTVASFPETEAAPQQAYEAVRFNAMKHGILSKLVVLAHEDAGEFSELMEALIEEHQPAGVTEMHLVEELASAIWRKRRVLLAENANINRNLFKVVRSQLNSPIPAAAPFERFLLKEHIDLFDLLKSSPEQITKYQHEAQLDLAATNKASAILRKGGANAYKKAQRALSPGYLSFWNDHIDENEYPDTVEGFSQFIREILAPTCIRTVHELQFIAAIKAQVLGEGLQADRLENLNRYETHLDRKFERSLGMLLKLKELRGNK